MSDFGVVTGEDMQKRSGRSAGIASGAIGREASVRDQDIAVLQTRDQTPAEAMTFE
ncbi:plasmid stabilization protein [Komagataeibacter rhaeticus]|nr:plasmid stabilization protein [Komagataeibacter rhaeticus]